MGILEIDDGLGHIQRMFPGDSISVGRNGQIVIGLDDDHMPRYVLQIWSHNNVWQIKNHCSHHPIKVLNWLHAKTELLLSPHASHPLPLGKLYVVFATRNSNYQLTLHIHGSKPEEPPLPYSSNLNPGLDLNLNHDQALLLEALTAKLRAFPGASDAEIPLVHEIAQQLGWTDKKTHSKLSYLARKIEKHGVKVSKPYRIGLARYTVAAGLI